MRYDPIKPIPTIERVVKRLMLDDRKSFGNVAGLRECLQPGWDITNDIRRVDDPGAGIYRAAHLLSGAEATDEQILTQLILRTGMNTDQFKAGLYRQIRLFPTNHSWRWDCSITSDRDCFSIAGNVDGDSERARTRDKFVIPILSITLEDLAICLEAWDKERPKLARLVLTKSFVKIGTDERLLAAYEWPKECLDRFRQAGMTRVLPPVMAFVAHAALAQLAQTRSAHLKSGYSDDGSRVTAKAVLDDIPTRSHGMQHRGTALLASGVSLQTLALAFREPQDLAGADDWGDSLVARAIDQLSIDGEVSLPDVDDRSLSIMIRHHPALQTRKLEHRRSMLANRPLFYWQGLTEAESAAVNLIVIMEEVEDWIEHFGHDIPVGSVSSVSKREAVSKAKAVAAFRLGWLESSTRAAFMAEARSIIVQQLKDENPCMRGNESPGETPEAKKNRQVKFDKMLDTEVNAASLETMMTERFGDSLWMTVTKLRSAGVGKVRQAMWRTFAHPHLWFRDVDEPVFKRLASWTHQLARKTKGAPNEVVTAMNLKGLGPAQGKRPSQSKKARADYKEQVIAAKAAQALRLMLTPQPTDLMLRLLVLGQLGHSK